MGGMLPKSVSVPLTLQGAISGCKYLISKVEGLATERIMLHLAQEVQ